MSGPAQDPRWRALEIGPGGVPAEQVRQIGPAGGPIPEAASVPAGPSAVFGSFEDERRRPSRKTLLALLVLAVVFAAVTLSSLWADDGQSATSAGDLRPADCLSSADDRSVVVVDCAAPDVEFILAAKYDNTRDGARCSTISTDLVLVTEDNTVLCLNYRASLGDCLYAGDAARIGKAPCREPGTSTPFGLYRVVAVLPNTVDVRGCPTGTITSLVHVADRQVLCLGLP
jgi:hypothetical protein